MKERFWFVYYWLMVGYLGLALLTIVEYQNKYELTEITHLGRYEAANEELKDIIVISPSQISEVARIYDQAMIGT